MTVTTSEGEDINCVTYQMRNFADVDFMELPSPQYLDIIIRGAVQNHLPSDYVEFLKSRKTNNNEDRVSLYEEIIGTLANNP